MIDFRYHLVSLISVFLALAVGVVLGAGPLQNSLGTALNDQVTQLRQDRQAMQTRLETIDQAVNERDSYIAQAAAAMLPGTLSGQKVALVRLPEADDQDVDSLSKQLGDAGAEVVGQVALTTAWIDPGKDSYRSTYAGQLAAYLPGLSLSSGNSVLGAALGKALTSQGEEASTLMDLLTATKEPLVTVETQPASPATMVVVLGPRAQEQPVAPTAPATPGNDPGQWVLAVHGLSTKAPAVVLGEAATPTGLVSLLRKEQTPVSTVDSVGQVSASVSTALALAAVSRGSVQHYGFDKGADSVMPEVPPVPVPLAPAVPASPGEDPGARTQPADAQTEG